MLDLQMLTQDDVAELLNVHRDTIVMYREVGILQSIKTGKCYMFSQQEIYDFQQKYKGFDVSNRIKAIESYSIVNSNTKSYER